MRVWLFDLDNTLHDATGASMAGINEGMTAYIERELGLEREAAQALRRHYWQRYGAPLLGLVHHHAVDAAHFLHHTHLLPGLEERLRRHAHDVAALSRLRGRKVVLTNAPRAYALRVLKALGLRRCFDAVFSIEDMAMFGRLRPKPDTRLFRRIAARQRTPRAHCVLVEDTLGHQKAARSVGMRTVWMQRWIAPEVGVYLHRRPAYVHARIRSLQDLRRWR